MAAPHSSPRGLIVFTTILLCAAVAHPLPSFADQSVTLKGHVSTKDGQAISSGVTISLEDTQGVIVASRPTDASGNYEFDGLIAARYQMTVTADQFQTYQQDVDLSFRATWYTVDVYLTPANKTEVKVPPALTDEAAPRTARKEFEKGEHALEAKKLPDARRHLEKAVGEYPCYARAQCALAQVDLHERNLDSAEAHFKKATQCDGSFLDAFSELAQLYIVEKKFVESQGILDAGMRLSPEAWLFRYQMGVVHYGMKQYAQAVQDYLTAETLRPQMPAEFHIKLGNAYLKTTAYDKALAEFETYLRLDPQGPFAPGARQISAMMIKGGITAAASAPPAPRTAPKP